MKQVSLYLFGSAARNELQPNSDIDVLVIGYEGDRARLKAQLDAYTQDRFGQEASISWYGHERIEEMYRTGHLFAWHLFQEAQLLPVPNNVDFLTGLGEPAPYPDARDDIESLVEIMEDSIATIQAEGGSLIYEAGVQYICIRNIAISLTAHWTQRPDFSRYSPFHPEITRRKPIPISREEYVSLLLSRKASMNGTVPPALDREGILSTLLLVLKWSKEITPTI